MGVVVDSSDSGRVGAAIEHRGHGETRDRMAHFRRDLGKRHEHEAAPMHLTMRNVQFVELDDPITEQQNVDVDLALVPASAPPPSQRQLDLAKRSEQLVRLERRLDRDRRVDECRLLDITYRIGLVQR